MRKSSITELWMFLSVVLVWLKTALNVVRPSARVEIRSSPWVVVEKSFRKNRNTGKFRASGIPSASRTRISGSVRRISCDRATRSSMSMRKKSAVKVNGP